MDILVTGGAGFIGSHTCVKLLQENYNVIIIDNFINSSSSVIDNICKIVSEKRKNLVLYKMDLIDDLDFIFEKHNIQIVIHFAGLKAVGESIKNPLLYHTENLSITLNLLNAMKKFNCYKFIFSSSATVYGNSESPLSENHHIGLNISNPYGNTKYLIEKILMDCCIDQNNSFISLRYFNPIGAHPSGLIGENPNDIPNNLMPYLLKVAYSNNISYLKGFDHLNIFGSTYNTPDGTAIRDYIHVEDLAEAHICAVKNINNYNGYNTFNVGTGKGTSVKELVNVFSNVNKVMLPIKITNKRDGDLEEVYCNNDKIKKYLHFIPKYNLNNMCQHSWNFQIRNMNSKIL